MSVNIMNPLLSPKLKGVSSMGELVSKPRLQELMDSISSLNADEKAQLVAQLLGQQPGMTVSFGNGSNSVLKADLVVQINAAESEVMQGVLDAIARRIER